MQLLRRATQLEHRVKLVFSAFLLLSGAAVGYLFFEKSNILATFGLAGVLVGLRMLWDVLRQSKLEGGHLLKLLDSQSRHIVWVYSLNTQTMPFGFYLWERGTMYFKLADGTEIALPLPARKLKMVSKFLNRLLPHASFGYSAERQRQFEENPASLLRSEKDSN